MVGETGLSSHAYNLKGSTFLKKKKHKVIYLFVIKGFLEAMENINFSLGVPK